MLGMYLAAALLGGGLLLFSLLAGGDHDAADVDVGDLDVDVDVDLDVDVDAADIDHDVDVDHGSAAALLLGFFRPRNFIFFLAAFGISGLLLTWLDTPADTTLILASGMGAGAFLLTHLVFGWLRRTETAIDAVSERELEGHTARVVLPLAPGQPGRVVSMVADREIYLTARLAADASEPIPSGREVVILGVEDGVAEVIVFDSLELPPAEES